MASGSFIRSSMLLAIAVGLSVGSSEAGGGSKTEQVSNEVSVEIDDGYMIVAEGSAGELHGLRFLLDTGTTITVIDRRVAKCLGLVGQPAKIINFDKTVSAELGEIPEITYGAEQAANVRVMIEDLRYLHPGGVPVDGIVGLDLLRRKSLLVDYARKRVVFGATESSGMRSAPMRANRTTLCVEVRLDGRPVWMIADTGMHGTVLYETGIEATPENYKRGERIMGRTYGGAVESQQTIVSQLSLGGQNLERQILLIRQPEAMRVNDVAGYLGPASLNAKQVLFDFAGNHLRWKK